MLLEAFDLTPHPSAPRIAVIPAISPGTTPGIWRRLVYGALARGIQGLDYGPAVPAPFTSSPFSLQDPAFIPVLRQTLTELTAVEEILLQGQPDPAVAAFWITPDSTLAPDLQNLAAAHRRALYLAFRHLQIPFASLADPSPDSALQTCRLIVVTDGRISQQAAQRLTAWVEEGGTLFTTAGAGWIDEKGNPNFTFRKLLGITPRQLDAPLPDRVELEKQDLPWAKPIDKIRWIQPEPDSPAFAAVARVALRDGQELARFPDGSPAVHFRKSGRGSVLVCHFLPGFTYLKPALPPLPPDRNSDPEGAQNRLPSAFDPQMLKLLQQTAVHIQPTVLPNSPLMETGWIRASNGWALAVVNWSPHPLPTARVTLPDGLPPFPKIKRASGAPISVRTNPGPAQLEFALTDADWILFH